MLSNFSFTQKSHQLSFFQVKELDQIHVISTHFPRYINFLIQALKDLPITLIFQAKPQNVSKYGQYLSLSLDSSIDFSLKSQIFNTVLFIENSQAIQILKPGIINIQELRSLLPKIKFSNNYHYNLFDLKNFEFIDSLDKISNLKSSNKKYLLATKEKIIENYEKLDGLEAINIGSQTNPENIFKFLANRLENILSLDSSRIYFLQQKWPKNHWGQSLEYLTSAMSLESV